MAVCPNESRSPTSAAVGPAWRKLPTANIDRARVMSLRVGFMTPRLGPRGAQSQEPWAPRNSVECFGRSGNLPRRDYFPRPPLHRIFGTWPSGTAGADRKVGAVIEA